MNKRKHHSTENKNYRQKGIHTYISVNIYIYIYREREREGLMLGTQSFLNY